MDNYENAVSHWLGRVVGIATGVISGAASLYVTVVGFVGGSVPVIGLNLSGGIGTGLICLFVISPIVSLIGYWIGMLVSVPLALLLRRRAQAGIRGRVGTKQPASSRLFQAATSMSYDPGAMVTTNVAGVTFEGRQELIQKLVIGQAVHLCREPDNPHDANAIRVVVRRYSDDERERLRPELERTHGQGSQEVASELYRRDTLGYIPRDLAAKIHPIFDDYALGPYKYVPAKVIALTGTENLELSRGLRIEFRLPTEAGLKHAIDREADMMIDTLWPWS